MTRGIIPTPLGRLLAAVTDEGVESLSFAAPDAPKPARLLPHAGVRARPGRQPLKSQAPAVPPIYGVGAEAILARLRAELAEYFDGRRKVFTVPIAVKGTPFQRLAWDALARIPYGQTRGYGQQAAEMGKPRAARAVGGANHRNPVSIIIPCHRVVGSNGQLIGYASGLWRKEWLLRHEISHSIAAKGRAIYAHC